MEETQRLSEGYYDIALLILYNKAKAKLPELQLPVKEAHFQGYIT